MVIIFIIPNRLREEIEVSECTYARVPIPKYSPRSLAAKDYEDLVDEYIAELNASGGEE